MHTVETQSACNFACSCKDLEDVHFGRAPGVRAVDRMLLTQGGVKGVTHQGQLLMAYTAAAATIGPNSTMVPRIAATILF
mmetsp:Transcript_57131/g.128424  ORF Transcript_57131/g.128424 Transcript_57131/m.128424 type:complete len:80 (-) Transcript_57131:995-1234(-)